jgi:oligopeptide/dipeptide ABC transporter ATP-binding protein
MNELSPLLEIKNLKVNFYLTEGMVEAVRGVDLKIYRNKTLGIVGESGCGKSVMSQAILRIVPEPGKISEGELLFSRNGGELVDLVKLKQKGKEIRNIRGKEISIIFQEPMTALSPLYTIGNQIIEAVNVHQGVNKKEALKLAKEMLSKVGIPRSDLRINQYPFELSGGLRQRAVIAMALICHPKLLIADEPTTALDVTIQAQILKLFKDLQTEFKMSVIFITHDIAVISEIADEVAVMYLGRIVEQGATREILSNPLHPYTKGLLQCVHKFGSKSSDRLIPIKGTLPGPFDKLVGCPFYPRCPIGDQSRCLESVPHLQKISNEHKIACFLVNNKIQ